MHPEPLEAGQDGRQFVPAVQGQENLFDGSEAQFGAGVKELSHKILIVRDE